MLKIDVNALYARYARQDARQGVAGGSWGVVAQMDEKGRQGVSTAAGEGARVAKVEETGDGGASAAAGAVCGESVLDACARDAAGGCGVDGGKVVQGAPQVERMSELPPPGLKMYTIEDVAVLLLSNYDTIRAEIIAGRLPAIRVGKRWRISADMLREYVNRSANRVPMKYHWKHKRQVRREEGAVCGENGAQYQEESRSITH